MDETRERQDLNPLRRLGLGAPREPEVGKKKEVEEIGGRRAIILLFLVTIVMSLLFWLQGNLARWLREFFGPSTWTFSR